MAREDREDHQVLKSMSAAEAHRVLKQRPAQLKTGPVGHESDQPVRHDPGKKLYKIEVGAAYYAYHQYWVEADSAQEAIQALDNPRNQEQAGRVIREEHGSPSFVEVNTIRPDENVFLIEEPDTTKSSDSGSSTLPDREVHEVHEKNDPELDELFEL